MAYLTELRVRRLRALEALEIAPDGGANLITGHNGAGKTTVLEAVFLLSRGRSFRGGDARQLIGQGATSADLSAHVASSESTFRVGLALEGRNLRARLNGVGGAKRAEIARILPVLSLDARLMDLVDRGPERRRRLLNWVTFHVEPAFNAAWGRFRRSLKQRNAGLREKAKAEAIMAWDGEFCRAAVAMEGKRSSVADRLRPRFARIAGELMGLEADWDYYQGWPRDKSLADSLRTGLKGDRKLGMTRFGPQRSDLVLRLETRRARYVASRGQQKLLAAALMLAATELLTEEGAGRPVLLADEPLVELDSGHADKLLEALLGTGSQVFVTAVDGAPYSSILGPLEIRLKGGALV